MLAIFSGQFYPLPDLHHYHRRSCPLQTLLSLGTAARKALDLRTYVCLLRYPPHRVFNVLPVFLLVGPRHFHKNIVVLSKLCGVHRFGGRFQVCTGSKVKKNIFRNVNMISIYTLRRLLRRNGTAMGMLGVIRRWFLISILISKALGTVMD